MEIKMMIMMMMMMMWNNITHIFLILDDTILTRLVHFCHSKKLLRWLVGVW
jgi:hypothetical protein